MGEAKPPLDVRYGTASPFLLAAEGTRLIQVQPTRRCNLRCLHCYSESGPDQRGDLDYGDLTRFLSEARALGYSYVGVSGGEPLLWKDLDRFLDFARERGFDTSISTNGTLLGRERAARLRNRAGLVAVSVDGPPEEHAAIRGSETAFSAMRTGLEALAQEGVRFSLAFTLTRHNADQVKWLYEFATEVGAAAIHVHPLCDFGGASAHLAGAIPDGIEFQAAGWLLALVIEQHGGEGPVAIMDVVRPAVVRSSCWPLADSNAAAAGDARFADLAPSLVVETDGCITPFIYGFPRQWAVGGIGREPLEKASEQWRARHAAPLAELVRATLERTANAVYIDLFAELLATALGRLALPLTRKYS